MGKRLIILLALAFVVGLTFAAYAEVQNVKVSGDITALGIYRNNLDLTKNGRDGATYKSDKFEDKREYFATLTRVRVDADLTDNVTATVRLLNERVWNGDSTTTASSSYNIFANGQSVTSSEQDNIDLDLAYVTAKEFLYSPLTMSVGRQELHFGNDWIVGAASTNMANLKSNLPDSDFSLRKAFDAFRATLDYNPLVVDIIYAKIAEKDPQLNDDSTLTGINAGYALTKNTNLEGFFFAKLKGRHAATVTAFSGGSWSATNANQNTKTDKVYTVGGRVVDKTIKNLTVDAQAAYQFGTYNPQYDTNANQFAQISRRNAWGAEVVANYDMKDMRWIGKYSPSAALAYVVLSGDSRENGGRKSYKGWDPMFENQTFGHLINGMFGFSNTNLLGLSLKAKPMDDVTVKFDAVGMWVYKRYTDGRVFILSGVDTARKYVMAKNPHMGNEFDLTLTYDYTEDVQLSLLGGIFLPGKAISRVYGKDGSAIPSDSGMKTPATELIGSMKVTF